jgi:phosphoglucosamine mutase
MDYATTGDGILSALQVLKLMKQTGRSILEMGRCMREYPYRLTSVPVAEKRPLHELAKLPGVIARCKAELGENGRAIVRYSGTEPSLRILVEARQAAAVERWVARIAAAAKSEIGA